MKKTYFLLIAALLSAIAGCYFLATRTATPLENDQGASRDGHRHVQLGLEAEYGSLLNQANLEKQHGYLVLEPICSNPVSQARKPVEWLPPGLPAT
jgi:hypothetical protein